MKPGNGILLPICVPLAVIQVLEGPMYGGCLSNFQIVLRFLKIMRLSSGIIWILMKIEVGYDTVSGSKWVQVWIFCEPHRTLKYHICHSLAYARGVG